MEVKTQLADVKAQLSDATDYKVKNSNVLESILKVTFLVSLAFNSTIWNPFNSFTANGKWETELGSFKVFVGGSSDKTLETNLEFTK